MIPEVAILIPVLNRPRHVAPLVESIDRTAGVVATPLFLVTPGDDAEIAAIREAGAAYVVVDWPAGPGDYSRKINYGARITTARWLFTGADDLRFDPAWAVVALDVARATHACVIGTNDLGNAKTLAGHHATHSLVHRDYLECGTIDEPGLLLHEGYDHNFCNPPEAPIWMADLSFRELGDVRVGDRVIGWQREPRGTMSLNRLCASDVLAVGRRYAPLVQVTMASGRQLVCTPDHQWLNAAWSPSSSHPRQWVDPQMGRQLLHVVDRPARLSMRHDRLAGWLAGIYDGEGSGVYVAAQCPKANPAVHAAIVAALDELEIPYSNPKTGRSVNLFNLIGGRLGYLDFLSRVQPIKREKLTAKILTSRFGTRDRIAAVEPFSGSHEVVSMQTSTGNYVAWGYASKNCDTEFVGTALARGTFAHAPLSVVEHLHPFWRKGQQDATYRKGAVEFHRDRRLYDSRRRLWA